MIIINFKGKKFTFEDRIFSIGSSPSDDLIIDHLNGKVYFIKVDDGFLIKKDGKVEVVVNEKKILNDAKVNIGDKIYINKELVIIEKDNSVLSIGELSLTKFIEYIVNILEQKDIKDALSLTIEMISRILDAEAARIVVEEKGDFINLVNYPSHYMKKHFSQKVIYEAKNLNKPVLIKDYTTDDPSYSVNINNISSILCVAIDFSLENYDKIFLYFDKRRENRVFDEDSKKMLEIFLPLIKMLLSKIAELQQKENKIKELLNQDFIYKSSEMEKVVEIAKRISKVDIPVYIYGETGVGKEKLAKFIHNNSPRKDKNFIAINCSAIPANLFESELFGYKKGAFTGAEQDKKGLIEEANGGTLFLDEIGEMPLEIQAKMLRVLQEKKILPLGDTKERDVDVRVICATNQDLQKLVKSGKFREDLYYRLNGIQLTILPLRERKEDILFYTKYFIKKYAREYGIVEKELTEKAKEKLLMYSWPGNIRELEMTVKRSLVISGDRVIDDKDIFLETNSTNTANEDIYNNKSLAEIRDDSMRQAIEFFLLKYEGNVSKVAKTLQVDRKSLTRIIERLQIDVSKFRNR